MMNHQKLRCYGLALELAKKVPTLIRGWTCGNAYLADQLKRAVSSIALNIAEGNGRTTYKERARFFAIARGSAMETSSIIDITFALEMIDKGAFLLFQDYLLQIVKILYKLR